jgi:hypothetical protein
MGSRVRGKRSVTSSKVKLRDLDRAQIIYLKISSMMILLGSRTIQILLHMTSELQKFLLAIHLLSI